LISGKISTGVVRIAPMPRIRIRIAITTKVYGLSNASLTIHISLSFLPFDFSF